MKRIFLLLLTTAAMITAAAQHIMLKNLVLDSCSVYPAVSHRYHVYIPGGYDGTSPAALYLGLDGVLCNAPAVLDSLIASGEMPVTIGVFLEPGVVCRADGEVIRYNRSNEFDMTDDRFARFIAIDLLPAVERLCAPDGRRIHLSRDPRQRAIFGASSGGIAAMMVAWHRPDLFSRVFTAVGTFVAMRGGNDVQALVRKGEPRPVRIFLQDGTEDAWNPLFGHWYEGNRLMESALRFAGYDLCCDWSETGHSITRAHRIFSTAMRWLWRNDSIAAGTTQNDLLASILIPGEEWQAAAPATFEPRSEAVYPDTTLAVAKVPGDNMLWQWLIAPDGSRPAGQRFYWLHSFDNAAVRVADMEFDSEGNLYVATNAGIQICDQNGRVRGIVMLPPECGEVLAMRLGEGSITLRSARGTYIRRFDIHLPACRPRSQGQG